MNKRVTIVEINIFEKMLPLVSGYLQAYASTDPSIRAEYEFEKYTTTVTTPFTQIVADLSGAGSSLYAFSCYLWNMGIVKSLLPALLKTNPDVHFLLGGPQVMRYAEEYLEEANYCEVSNYPTIYHIVLHERREEFDRSLHDFASSQPFWKDECARFLFEIDMLAKPYIYANTPVDVPDVWDDFLTTPRASGREVVVTIPNRLAPLIAGELHRAAAASAGGNGDSRTLRLSHKREQHPLRSSQTREENASYCSGSIMRIADILPTWTPISNATRGHC